MFNFIPLYYTFQSRIITKSERVSWVLIFPLFLLLISLSFNLNVYIFILSFLCVMSIYEVGYLYNDIITVKKEIAPTIRIKNEMDGFKKSFYLHIIFRVIISVSISIWIFYLTNSGYLFYAILCVSLFYIVHNTIRSRINIISYFCLVSARYIFPVFLIVDSSLLIFLLLIFPICRTIEHACKKKYNLNFLMQLVSNIDRFRVKYYFFLLIIYMSLFLAFDIKLAYVLFALYFLIIRLLSSKLRNVVKTNVHKSY